ncbi:MAG TPA: LacI family DNA-binding transcriptional regulator [Gammaproteobacteria bacterium]
MARKPDNREPGKNRVTLQQVAELAGVSAMTVSRALNNDAHITPATRERVIQAASALQYHPNLSARRLAAARSFIIGLLYDDPTTGYFSELLIGSLNKSHAAGYHLVIEPFTSEYKDVDNLKDRINHLNLDGVIIPERVGTHKPVTEILKKLGLPLVRVAPPTTENNSPCVFIDNQKAAFEMTEYLISLGHTNIGFIKGHALETSAILRFQGYKNALLKHGLPFSKKNVMQGDFSYKSGLKCSQKLLSLRYRPTAVFASNDYMAAAVITTAHIKGLRIPENLSVAGFDDIPFASTTEPQLTTVNQPVAAMGAAAVGLLVDIINDSSLMETSAAIYKQLDYKIVIRGSTAPVNKKP